MVVISLISRGSPAQMTGGHLYHQRMAELAATHGAMVERITARDSATRCARRVASYSSTASRRGRWPPGCCDPVIVGGRSRRSSTSPLAGSTTGRSEPRSNGRSTWPSTGAAISWSSPATASHASWSTAGTCPPSGSAWWSRGATSRTPCGLGRRTRSPSRASRRAAERRQLVAQQGSAGAARRSRDPASRPRHAASGRARGRRARLRPARARAPRRPRSWQSGWLCMERWHRPRSAGSTPEPTCSRRPAPARRTAWSTARRWRPGSRSSVGVAGACLS